MNFEQIKQLINIIDESKLIEFDLKLDNGFHIRTSKLPKRPPDDHHRHDRFHNRFHDKCHCHDKGHDKFFEMQDEDIEKTKSVKEAQVKKQEKSSQKLTIEEDTKEGQFVTAPIVGTFYESSSPSAKPFVKKGDKVKKGDTLCIIEAMKVMNEIKSTYSGEIAEILVKNEQMVEYNQPLFKII